MFVLKYTELAELLVMHIKLISRPELEAESTVKSCEDHVKIGTSIST